MLVEVDIYTGQIHNNAWVVLGREKHVRGGEAMLRAKATYDTALLETHKTGAFYTRKKNTPPAERQTTATFAQRQYSEENNENENA